MNRVLTRMTTPILDYQGTIDKYIGDSVMAFWNAPLADPEHLAHACRAALQMLDKIDTLNAELRAEAQEAGEKPSRVAIRIGLNSSECTVGKLGSEQHFNYSALGDPVNLASRLEGQAKFHGCPIIAGEHTAHAAGDFAFFELDLIRVVGKTEAVRVYALLGKVARRAEPDFARLAEAHAEMLGAYCAADWSRAVESLKRCRRLAGNLPLAKLYRIYEERVADTPRVQDVDTWDGVYEARQK